MTKRTGRRRGSPDTRESILDAARRLFAEKGFDATTVRAIAADAGVDPALIHHYFGTKEELFRQSLRFPIDPKELVPQLFAGGQERLGHRLVAEFVRVWDSPAGTAGAALMRSAMSSEWTTKLLREFMITQLLRRIVAQTHWEKGDAQLRMSLVASQLAGLAMMRHIIRLEPLASLPADQVVALVGPAIQRYLTGALPAAK